MTNGLASRLGTFSFVFISCLALFSMPGQARSSASAHKAAVTKAAVTILSVGAHSIQILGENGRAETLAFGPASAFLRRGLLVRASEFLPGETATLQRHTGSGGIPQVGLLCDPESAAALKKYRGRLVSGTLLSLSAQVWVVQPSDAADGAAPLSLLVTGRTVWSADGATVAATAFEPGASVTVATRGLPSGLLALVAASADEDTGTPAPLLRRRFVSGVVTEVQPSTLTLQTAAGVSRTVGMGDATHVKVRREAASLADISTGMRVSVWLTSQEDASGNPVASTVSATDAARIARKKNR